MLKKIITFVLAFLLFSLSSVNLAYAADSNEIKDAKFAVKVKEGIKKLGIGKDAQVEIKLRDKTKLKGYISEAGENSFVVTNAKMGESTVVPYPAVKKAKGKNLNTGVKIVLYAALAIGITIAAVVILVTLGERGATDH